MRGLVKEEFETWLEKKEFKKKLGKKGSEKSGTYLPMEERICGQERRNLTGMEQISEKL